MPEQLTLDEQRLLQQLSNGDPAALRTVVLSYFPLLCNFAERYLPDEFLVKDIVQESFIKLWKHNSRFESLNGLKSFLFTITKHACLNQQRSMQREGLRNARFLELNGGEEADTYYDEVARLNSLAAINEAVLQLPQKMQEVFLLSYGQGLSNEEIARKLNISEKTVRNQKYNSLVLLRRQLGNSRQSFSLLLLILKYSGFFD